jgi:hypothetical protein
VTATTWARDLMSAVSALLAMQDKGEHARRKVVLFHPPHLAPACCRRAYSLNKQLQAMHQGRTSKQPRAAGIAHASRTTVLSILRLGYQDALHAARRLSGIQTLVPARLPSAVV